MSGKRVLPLMLASLCASTLCITTAHAEGPMHTDDAGTLNKGGMKVEAVWSRDSAAPKTNTIEALFGLSVIENLEFEVGLARDRNDDAKANVVGFGAKWVPIQNETGWSLGARFDYGQARVNESGDKSTERDYALTGLASYRMENSQILHVNLGLVRTKDDDTKWENVGTWSLGYEFPLLENLQLTADLFGEENTDPNVQLGLRYEIIDGLKVSGAIGRGNARNFGQVGFAWEF